ncbi:MAG: hypothetical protein IKK63_08420 [Clostridia bacterium]|nr:hypothetical protein [Clostridia bacterium]
MNTLFLDFLNISITASYIILAVILVRLIFPKLPRKFICILWAIAGIRLVLPFSLESVFSLIPSAETVPPDIVMSHSPTIQSGIPMLNSVVNPVISNAFAPDVSESVNPMQILTGIAWNVWIIGIAVLLIYGIVSYFRVKKTVSDAVLLNGNIWQSEKVVSPFILGIIKPKIYIPYGMDGEIRDHVVAHENAHLKRRDHWIKPLGFLLLAVYWFNPLIWVAYILLCKDIERACDEKVISQMNEDNRKEYASALLECAVNRRRIAACPLAFGETGLKERVKGIMNYKKPAFWVIVIAVIACIVAAVCFLTNPKTPAEYTELGYRLNITEEIYTMTTQLPDKTEKKSYKVGEGTKGELSNGTKFEITETNLQTGELTIKFSGEPIYSLVGSTVGNGLKECGQIVINENEPHTLADDSNGVYRRITFEFVKTEELENVISDAIIQTHRGGYKLGTYACETHEIFATEASGPADNNNIETVTVYMWVNYGEYIKYGDSLVEIGGSACPTVLTFECVDGKYNLTEYWTASDGSRYADSIREKYPKNIVSEVLSYNYDSKSLDKKAEAYFYDNKKFYSATNYGNVSVDVASYNLKDFGKTASGEYLKLEWQNHSGTDWFSYGNSFYMERFNPDLLGFEVYKPTEEPTFTAPVFYVEPGQKREQWYDLGLYDFSQPGYYRFVTNFNFDEMNREGVAIVDFTVGDIALEEKTPEELTTQAVFADNDFKALFSRVGYSQNGTDIINKFAEKAIYTPNSGTEQIPVIRFDSGKELDSFINAARKPFRLDGDWEKEQSFLENTKGYTEEFFEEKSVVLVKLTEPSGSFRHKVNSVTKKNGIAEISISRLTTEPFTDDVGDWFITIAVDKSFLSDCKSITVSRGKDENLNSQTEKPTAASGETLNYTSDVCFVNYVEDGESILMKYAEVPMWSPYSSTEHHSVAMFETLQGFNDFYNKTQNSFSYDSYNGYPSVNQARAKYTKEFFEENNLLIAYIPEPSTDIRLEVMSVVRHHTLHIEIRRRVPDACDTAMAGWFVIVGVNKADMKENDLAVASIAETISGEPIFRDKKTEAGTVSYIMMSSNAYVNPYLDLMTGNRFHFFISPFDSHYHTGNYRYDNDNLILETDDGLYTYVFRKDGDNLVFVADKSSEIQKYKSSAESAPVAAVKDGDVFVKV